MTEEKRREILAANKAMADKALRVLAAALRRYEHDALGTYSPRRWRSSSASWASPA